MESQTCAVNGWGPMFGTKSQKNVFFDTFPNDILRVSNWQSKSDLDTIHNSCNVYITKRNFSTGYFLYLTKKSIDGTGGSNFTNPRRHYLIHVFLKCISSDKNLYILQWKPNSASPIKKTNISFFSLFGGWSVTNRLCEVAPTLYELYDVLHRPSLSPTTWLPVP